METTEQLIKITSIVYAVVQLFIYFHIYGFLEYLKSRNRISEQCLHNPMLLVILSLLWDPIHYVCSWHWWSLWTNELWPRDICILDWSLKYRSHILRINEELPKGGTDRQKWYASSVQFSRSVVSDSLQPHELQYTRPPCPSPTPRVHPNSRP